MGDLQFNSGNPDASGKTGANSSSAVLILFGLPFLFFGLIALAAAVQGAGRKDMPVLGCAGFLFFCVGLGIMVTGFRSRKKAKQTAGLQAQHPDQPWLWRDDWAAGKIRSSAMAQPKLYLVMALAFCSIGGLTSAFSLPEELHKKNYAALAVLCFPLIGIGFLIAFISAWRSQRRFGECFFELAQIPIPPGGVLDGMIETGAPLKLEHELNLRISCLRRVAAGKNTHESVLWQSEKIYTPEANLSEPEPGHTGIPVHFKLPEGQPQCFTRGGVSVFWRLEAKSKMSGPDFHATFDVPVFKVASAATAETADADSNEFDPTAGLQAPIEEIRREEHSKIQITDGPNGQEFYFPAARNIGTALFTTLLMLIFNGIAVITFHFHAPVLFPIAFGLFGTLLLFGTFSLWFKSSRVTIDSTSVRAVNRWLFFSRTRRFAAADVARFATKSGMQSGSQVFLDIKLITQADGDRFAANETKAPQTGQLPPLRFRASDPGGSTIASGIASPAEANWLVQEMTKALGRRA